MPKCRDVDCERLARWGTDGGPAVACHAHRGPDMVAIYSRHCDHPEGCLKTPNYGLAGDAPTRCSRHKDPGMVNVFGKNCDQCSKRACFGAPGATPSRLEGGHAKKTCALTQTVEFQSSNL